MTTVLEQTGPLAPADKPWQLIRDAIHDLTLQEQTLGVRIQMGAWHSPHRGECEQCLAGCVMSRRLAIPVSCDSCPSEFGPSILARLLALDEFRVGDLLYGLCRLGVRFSDTDLPHFMGITPYTDNPAQFKRDMLDLADLLERELSNDKVRNSGRHSRGL